MDDPTDFGEIAAANAFSDVYAMGGRPLLAMNIVGFPVGLPKTVLGDILKGGASKAREAGVLIVGGHTVDDKEPKYGMAVTGLVRPGEQVTNAGALPGDVLVLTKPIGSGIITTAAKAQTAPRDIIETAVSSMKELNHAASDVMTATGVNACVDVTGFGLLGHLRPMIEASGVSARLSLSAVPVLDGAWELVRKGIVPGGTGRNLSSLEAIVGFDPSIDAPARLMLCDAQTSGGLLMAVPRDRLDALLAGLRDAGAGYARIGEISGRETAAGPRIAVTP